MQKSQRQLRSPSKRSQGTFVRMWMQRASYTSQLDRKLMLYLPRNKHGRSGSASDHVGSTPARGLRAGALLFLALSTSLAANVAEPHHVTAVRFWSLSGVTRIAIETDGDFELKSDRLDNPDRLFFDLVGTRPTLGRKSMTVIPVSDHLVKQIRVAEPQHNVTRVVLDLETSVQPTTSRLDNPTRLIIELRASGSAPQTPKPETTQGPIRTPPALVQPPPGPKPVDRRPFTPPPAPQPAAIPALQPQEASLDLPPDLPPTASIAAGPLATVRRSLPTPVTDKATAPPTSSGTPPPAIESPLPAKHNSTGDHSMIRVLGLKVGRIVLDPGH